MLKINEKLFAKPCKEIKKKKTIIGIIGSLMDGKKQEDSTGNVRDSLHANLGKKSP